MKLYYGTDDHNYQVLWKSNDLCESERSVLQAEMEKYDSCKKHSPILSFFCKSKNGTFRYFMRVDHESGEGRSKYYSQCYIDPIRQPEDYLENEFLNNIFEDIFTIRAKYKNNGFNEEITQSVRSSCPPMQENDLYSILCWLIDNLQNDKVMRLILPDNYNNEAYVSYNDQAMNIIRQLYECLPAGLRQAVGCCTYWNGDRNISKNMKLFITDEKTESNLWFTFALGKNESYRSKEVKTLEIVDQLIYSRQMDKANYFKGMAEAYFSISHSNSNQWFTHHRNLLYDCHDFVCMQKKTPRLNQYFVRLVTDQSFKDSVFYGQFLSYLKKYFDLEDYASQCKERLNKCKTISELSNSDLNEMIEVLNQYCDNKSFSAWIEEEIERWFGRLVEEETRNHSLEEQDKILEKIRQEWVNTKCPVFAEKVIEKNLTNMREMLNQKLEVDLQDKIETVKSVEQYEEVKREIDSVSNRVNESTLISRLNRKLNEIIECKIEALDDISTNEFSNLRNLIEKYEGILDVNNLYSQLDERKRILQMQKANSTFRINSRKDLFEQIIQLQQCANSKEKKLYLCIGNTKILTDTKNLRSFIQFLCDGESSNFRLDESVLLALLETDLLMPIHFAAVVKEAKSEELREKVLDYFLHNPEFTIPSNALTAAFAKRKSTQFVELKKELCSPKMLEKYSDTQYLKFVENDFKYKSNIRRSILTAVICCLITVGMGAAIIFTVKEKKDLPLMLAAMTDETYLEDFSASEKKEINEAMSTLSQYFQSMSEDESSVTGTEELASYIEKVQDKDVERTRLQRIGMLAIILYGLSSVASLILEKKETMKVKLSWIFLGITSGICLIALFLFLL